jgi:hypothetical protein
MKKQLPPRRSSKPQILAPNRDRTAVVVLGMHRSGTSALAGALAHVGVDFGERLAAPAFDNKKGFWEHPQIVTLHDRLLAELGSSWHDERPLPAGWTRLKAARDIRTSLTALIGRDFGGKPLFGFKDPRLSRLVPLWLPIFQMFEITPVFVLMIRHPWEVCQSLQTRNGMSPAKSVLLWLRYTFEAEMNTRGRARSLVAYGDLLDDRARLLTRISRDLRLPAHSPERLRRALGGFLSKGLRHHRVDDATVEQTPKIALEVYESLVADIGDDERTARLTELSLEFDRSAGLFQPRLDDLRAAGLNFESEIASLGRQHEKDIEEKTAQALHFQRDADERAKHIGILQAENEEKTQQVLHFQRDAEERAKHIAVLQAENDEKTQQVLHFQRDAEERAKHIALLQAENDQKTQQVLHFQREAEERTKHIVLLQAENEEKTRQVLHFKRDADERARHIALLQAESDEKTNQIAAIQRGFSEKATHVTLLQAENEQKTTQILEIQRAFEEKVTHVALLTKELEERTRQVDHFKREAEENAARILLLDGESKEREGQLRALEEKNVRQATRLDVLQRRIDAKTQRIRDLKWRITEGTKDLEEIRTQSEGHASEAVTLRKQVMEASAAFDRVQGELVRQQMEFDGEKDRQSRTIDELAEEIEEKKGLLAEQSRVVFEAQWEAMTLRTTVARQSEAADDSRAQLAGLKAALEVANSDKQQLRQMITALENDLERERQAHWLNQESRLAELRSAQHELKTVASDLRRYKKQMNNLRETISRRLIFAVGKSKRKLQQLATVNNSR